MRIYEDFTRCECGEVFLKKEELICAAYDANQFVELPSYTKVIYRCVKCDKIVHKG